MKKKPSAVKKFEKDIGRGRDPTRKRFKLEDKKAMVVSKKILK